jgi:hypothetical protein
MAWCITLTSAALGGVSGQGYCQADGFGLRSGAPHSQICLIERFERQGCVEFVGDPSPFGFAEGQDDGKNSNSGNRKAKGNCKNEQQVLRCAKDDNRIPTDSFCWASGEVLLKRSDPSSL